MSLFGQRAQGGLQDPGSASSPEDGESWLITYLDVITLMLTLFVVLLAFSDFTTSEVEEHPTVDDATVEIDPVPAPEPPPHDLPGESLLPDDISGLLRQEQVPGISVRIEGDTLTIDIGDHLLFSSGETYLTGEGQDVLVQIAKALQENDYPVSIEGHTDNVPIATLQFPSNWELAAARATSVLRHLKDHDVDRSRLRAVGYADTRPVVSNETAEGRARNRRVELVIELR